MWTDRVNVLNLGLRLWVVRTRSLLRSVKIKARLIFNQKVRIILLKFMFTLCVVLLVFEASLVILFLSIPSLHLIVSIILPVILSFLLMYLYWLTAFWCSKSVEKCSPYECGFEPFSRKRIRFSVRFFLIAILFVIFDVELCLLSPFLFCIINIKNVYRLISFILFIVLLFFGLLHELREGSLDWVK